MSRPPPPTSTAEEIAQGQFSQRSRGSAPLQSKVGAQPRQPFGVKNNLPGHLQERNSSSTGGSSGGGDKYDGQLATPQQEGAGAAQPKHQHHLLQQRLLQARLLAGGASLTGSSSTSTSGSTPVQHHNRHAAIGPSPLGAAHVESSKSAGSIAPVAQTPRKRTAPFDEILQTRLVRRANDTSSTESPKPHKRSRSSKTDSSVTNENVNTSTSTGSSITAPLRSVQLDDSPDRPDGGVTEAMAIGQRVATATAGQDAGAGSSLTSAASQVSRQTTMPGPPPRPKTTRINKQTCMTEADRIQRERLRQASQMEWRKRFIKAFPGFRFYLDGFDQSGKNEVIAAIEQLGASVEPFFSSNATHLVTARRVSLPIPTENSTANSRDTKASTSDVSGPGRSSQSMSLRKKHVPVPLHSDRNPFEESGPPVSSNDILVKARSFGIKIWTFDKFHSVIKGLIGEAGSATDDKQQLNLSQMLEKEKLQGTVERDPLAARNDYHYFSRSSIFLLIEDSTAEHRPIMLQEWEKPAPGTASDDVPWPMLHGELEGRCPFTKYEFEGDPRKRTKPNRHETLRRSVSLNHMRMQQNRIASLSPAPSGDSRGGYGVVRGASPYPLASGNSVSIASGVASTTSTAMGSAVGSASGVGLLSPFGPLGRQINQASTSVGMGRPSALPTNIGGSRPMQLSSRLSPFERVRSGEQTAGAWARRAVAGPSDHRSRIPNLRSISTPTAGEAVQREKKPGYCENCRVKYEDFDDHIGSRRHRKFAKDDSNFSEIDGLLNRVVRPIAAWASGESFKAESGMPASSPPSRGFDMQCSSPASSLVAAGGSLDEALRLVEDGNNAAGCVGAGPEKQDRGTDFDQKVCRSPPRASPRSVRETVSSWQQETAEHLGSGAGDSTFIDHAVIHEELEAAHEADLAAPGRAPEVYDSAASPGVGSYGFNTTAGHGTEESRASASPHTSPALEGQDLVGDDEQLRPFKPVSGMDPPFANITQS